MIDGHDDIIDGHDDMTDGHDDLIDDQYDRLLLRWWMMLITQLLKGSSKTWTTMRMVDNDCRCWT